MDPASLALGIVALYSACRDCYDFFTTVHKAEKDSSSHLRELEIQQSILKAWGFHWQIQNDSGKQPRDNERTPRKHTKLHEYLLNNRYNAEGVFKTLSALADTLSNQEKLGKRYGIQLRSGQTAHEELPASNNVSLVIPNATIEDVKPVFIEVKQRLSVLNKFKWALKDRDSFQKLIADLKAHSESLYRLCPENAFESMNMYLTMECLAKQESPLGLKSTSRLAIEQAAGNGSSSMRAGYELLSSAATLKASVNENRDKKQANGSTLIPIDEEQRTMSYLGKGLSLFEDRVVYVEMRDYRGRPLELTPEQKKGMRRQQNRERRAALRHYHTGSRSRLLPGDGTHELHNSGDETDDDHEPIEIVRPADPQLRALIVNIFDTFRCASMRDSVHGLDIAGMIDHTEGEYKGHCSILYKLPGTIGIQTRERPAENLNLRAPATLQSLLGNRCKESRLGARFELARKLVRAVCLLHSSGWLHKNIRAESVMFFPEHVSALEEDGYGLQVEIDVSKPILMGYIFSRPDDISSKRYPPPLRPENDHPGPDFSDVSIPHSPPPFSNSQTQFPHTWDDPTDATRYDRARARQNSSIYGYNVPVDIGWKTRKTNINGFKLDYYQHPAKHAKPKRLY